MMHSVFLLLLLYPGSGWGGSEPSVRVSTQDVDLLTSETANVTVYLTNMESVDTVSLSFSIDNDGVIQDIPPVTISKSVNATLAILPKTAGHVVITPNTTATGIRTNEGFVRVTVMKSKALDILSTIVGWVYFVAWSVSFYPQIYENFKRKSVIGLNFDFLSLNIVGFSVYGVFNVGLFWIPSIQDEYFEKHPEGVNPVQANDVFFTLHAVFACLVTIMQCVMYQRGGQRVSRVCLAILVLIVLFLSTSLIVSLTGKLAWLDFLYFCSYVKLGITLIKYIPQAFMNYRRKSTAGWSIGNILLDSTGGSLSILQMFIISYNNDDWGSIFGDPTKFGLGAFSILFDILFIVQHYLLYRGNMPHLELEGVDQERSQEIERRGSLQGPP